MLSYSITADRPEPEIIAQAADVLQRGGLVAYPTDTLYGLAVDPRNGDAVARLFAAKGRGSQSAIPLIAASVDQAQGAAIFDERALLLARVFWPGPLTIVVPPRAGLAVGGARWRDDASPCGCRRTRLRARWRRPFGFCITATSANRSGVSAAVTGAEVAAAFASGTEVDVLLDAGAVTGGPPSTIVEIGVQGPQLIRAGAVSWNRVLESLSDALTGPTPLPELRRGSSKPSAETVQRSTPSDRHERAALVGLFDLSRSSSRQVDPEHSLDELAGLAAAAGATVVLRVLQERPRPDPATFLGSGKVETLAASCDESRVDVVIFDNELTPAQLRNLEKALGRKVVDRTQLILDIFARRARTREGKLQVELAQLKYLLPRLVGSSEALSRLGGGIGTEGPGETKLETDRRRIRHRISVLSDEIDDVRRRRAQLRERRQKGAVPTVALVGYTNAGKTTLFNALTRRSGGGIGRAVRHARSARPQSAAARPAGAARVRHRRVHRPPAALARGGVSRHARGSGRRRTCCCTSSMHRIPTGSCTKPAARSRPSRRRRPKPPADPAAPAKAAPKKEGTDWWGEIKGIFWLILAVLGFHSFIAKPFYIPSESMMPAC